MKAASYRSVARQQRGTAILLVVAVLVLLAVIGMVYVVSSRAEKMNARSNQEAAGLDLARDALLTTVRTALFDYTIDKTDGTAGMPGQIGGLSGVAASPTFNQLAARRYDYPHDNSPSSTGNLANATNGLTTSYFKDEALLGDGIASRGLWNKNASYVVGDRVSYGTSNSAIRGYVAITTSTNAIPSTATANWAPCGNSASRIDPTYPWFSNFNGNPTSTPVVPPGALNVIDPTMIDPATIINANVNPLGMILDGPVQVLPVHSGSNVQYRYALRVIDTNRMLNINTGSPFQPVKTSSTTAQTLLPYGNYLSSIWIGRPRSGNDPISSVANNGPLNDSDTGSVSALQDYNTAPFGRGGPG